MSTKKTVPTLSDVATLAGVSKAVASRALSGKDRPISADKKERVLKAAEKLGYVANPFAQSLSNKSTNLIAVVVNHITDMSDLSLFDSLIQAIQSLGKQTLFIRLRSEQDIDEIKRNAFVHRVDAALIFSDLITAQAAPDLFYTDKVIMLNGNNTRDGLSVIINEALGIKNAVNYAQQGGIKKAMLLAGRKTSAVEKRRIESYQTYFKDNAISLETIAYCNYSYQDTADYFNLLDVKPSTETAIFCTSDSMAMAALDFVKQVWSTKPVTPPIFGFDNTPFSNMGSYCFSTIGYNKEAFINAILLLLKTDKTAIEAPKHVVIDTEFYMRQ